ncbi:E3 ubiquitin-protein ligase TRIM71 [Aplysia californica]|uniref:E3 ubiquitin-protein ligase TRIM71 n=1 Tax=Aplysia californica TaxID=6500 RepID=A0ABM0JTQ1_APLCA|nr:E3 ubiquitin-protein ligase TRIM71 [Aplysia californica]
MVDFQSHYRVYPHGFTSDPPRVGVKTNRELYHEEGRKVFRKRHDRPVHDCRHEVMKDHTDRQEFETWVLSHGMTETYRAVEDLHDKSEEPTPGTKKPDKLLYKLGETGSAPGDFRYPRGLCTTMDCDILVADSMNHRVQHLNQYGVYKKHVGKQGQGNEEFNEPCDVLELPNGDIAVADKKNKRVQVLTEDLKFKYSMPIAGEPFSLGCDRDMNVAVATTRKEIFIFNSYDRVMLHHFPVGAKGKSSGAPIQISMSNDSEILVSDPEDGHVYLYTLEGRCFCRFSPEAHSAGLSVMAGDVCFTPLGQILVVDVLNHVINVYTDNGEFLQQVLVPTDDVGSVHSLALGLEGHLVVSEFSVGGDHCIKIFRYRQCPCHEGKTPGSKKRTPVASPNM